MRIWMDALTPKQLLLFNSLAAIAEKEEKAEVLLTTRETAEIKRMNSLLGEKARLIGFHGKNKYEKIISDALRMAELAKTVRDFSPDVLVSYPSPSAVRVAFGLGTKTVIYSDTPHAFHVHMLTVPLSDYLIFSSFIERDKFMKFVPRGGYTRIVKYRGVDEVAWVRGFQPNPNSVKRLGLEPYRYFLVRPPEIYASYYKWRHDDFFRFVKDLSKISNVALVPRYDDDAARYSGSNVVVVEAPILGLDLEYYSIATISGGGTMSREAALLGVPSITLFPLKLDVDYSLRRLGFPIFRAHSPDEAMKLVEDIVAGNIKRGAEDILDKLEHPFEPLRKILRGEL